MSASIPAADLSPGDIIMVDGVPVDIIEVDIWMYTVKVYLSDDPEDCARFPRDATVQVVAHIRPHFHRHRNS
jgi:hypothetical protein